MSSKERYRPGSRIGAGANYRALEPGEPGAAPCIKVSIKKSTQEKIDARAREEFKFRAEIIREVLEREFPDG